MHDMYVFYVYVNFIAIAFVRMQGGNNVQCAMCRWNDAFSEKDTPAHRLTMFRLALDLQKPNEVSYLTLFSFL